MAVSAKPNALFVNRKLIPTYGLQVGTQQPRSKLWAKSESLYIQLVSFTFPLGFVTAETNLGWEWAESWELSGVRQRAK